ncbi:hypothetical protein HOI26_03085 [Candidatus Woesearchaeota archaeon]|jgi:hypothetical protein|nr:hypothetical protein [Candidatus Woesearchaeota archaeon]MBT5740063.1 hypothetical protein [Candidatus Woesearchaeota archaeon]
MIKKPVDAKSLLKKGLIKKLKKILVDENKLKNNGFVKKQVKKRKRVKNIKQKKRRIK